MVQSSTRRIDRENVTSSRAQKGPTEEKERKRELSLLDKELIGSGPSEMIRA